MSKTEEILQVALDAVLADDFEKARDICSGLTLGREWIGKEITFYCAGYIYHGVLAAIEPGDFLITQVEIVYNTGPHSDDGFENSATLTKDAGRIRKASVEFWAPGVKSSR